MPWNTMVLESTLTPAEVLFGANSCSDQLDWRSRRPPALEKIWPFLAQQAQDEAWHAGSAISGF